MRAIKKGDISFFIRFMVTLIAALLKSRGFQLNHALGYRIAVNGSLGVGKVCRSWLFRFRTYSGGTDSGDGAHRTEARARALGIAGGCRPRASGGARKNALEVRAFLNVSEFALPHSNDRRGPTPPHRGEGSLRQALGTEVL